MGQTRIFKDQVLELLKFGVPNLDELTFLKYCGSSYGQNIISSLIPPAANNARLDHLLQILFKDQTTYFTPRYDECPFISI